jgi:uncharacterized protein
MTFIKRHALAIYFALAYGIAWLTWGSQIAEARGWLAWSLPESIAFLGVSLAALTTTALANGRAGLKEYLRRFVRWRVGAPWYAVTLLLTAAISVSAIAIHLLLGGSHDWSAKAPLSFLVPLFLTQVLTHLLTEEAGWRGFALPRLQARFNALTSSMILGALWAGWHIPLFLMPDSHQTYPFAGFFLMAMSITIIMTWIFHHTQGSVLIAGLFHAAMNATLAVTNTLWSDPRVFWIYTALVVIVAAAIVIIEGPERLMRRSSRRESLAATGSIATA